MGITTEQTKRRRVIGWTIGVLVILVVGGVITNEQFADFLKLAIGAL